MKAVWETKPLGDICTLQRGFDLPTQNRKEGAFPLVSSSGVIDAHIEGPVSPPGVVTGRSGSIGNVFYIEEAFWPLNTTLYVRDFWGNDPRFVFHLLNSIDLKSYAGGTGVPTLNRNDVHQVFVKVPTDKKEQHRIVTLLDEAFADIATAKANAEKNLQNVTSIFGNHLQATFSTDDASWERKTLGDVFTTATGTTPPKSNASFYGDFIPLVKPPELLDDVIESAPDSLTESGAEAARVLPTLSVLVSCIGNLGKIGINTVPVCFNQQINAILPNEEKALPDFMFYQALSPVFKKQLEGLASGTTVPIVNKSKFNSIQIALPPLEQQANIVEQLKALREETKGLESIYRQKLTALDDLKKSLLHQAFSGQL